MSDELVYSSNNAKVKQKTNSKKTGQYKKSQGPTKMRLEKKGRGGKQVTVLFNLPFEESEAKKLMQDLKTKLACGGSFKGGCIFFNGDMRDKIQSFFEELDQKIVRSGG